MAGKKNIEKNFLIYKGKPLIRCGNIIYYGNISDRFIIEMRIKDSYDIKDLKVSNKVSVRLIDLGVSENSNRKIIKMSEKNTLYNALDIGCVWLERAISYQNS